MRVLQVSPRYFPNHGGVEVVVKHMSELLTERGLTVTVYSLDLSHKTVKQQKINGVLVKRFKPIVGDPLYLPPPSFFKEIVEEDFDLVHVHNAHTLIPTFVAFSKKGERKILLQSHYHKFGQTRIRNSLLNLHKHILDKLVFPRVEFVIANSPYEKKILREDFPHNNNIVLIREGMPVAELGSIKWMPEKPARILCVGSLLKYKNIESLLKAFTYLVKNNEEPFRLVIIGDGPEREHLMNLARRLEIEDYTEWKRYLLRSQLLAEYSRASVFVSLSVLESFSRVVNEAVLVGVPTVVRSFGPTADLVEANIAVGVDSLHPSVIAESILKAALKAPVKLGQIQNFFLGWEEYVDKILELYREALNSER